MCCQLDGLDWGGLDWGGLDEVGWMGWAGLRWAGPSKASELEPPGCFQGICKFKIVSVRILRCCCLLLFDVCPDGAKAMTGNAAEV